MINEGLNLMLFGMGTVFVFLTLLVFSTIAMSRLLGLLPAEVDSENMTKRSTLPISSADPKLVAVIESAIAQHRNR